MASFSVQYVAFTTLLAVVKGREYFFILTKIWECSCLKTKIYAVTPDLLLKIGVLYSYFAGTTVEYLML